MTFSIKWKPEAWFEHNGHVVHQCEGFVLRALVGSRSFAGWYATRRAAQCALAQINPAKKTD